MLDVLHYMFEEENSYVSEEHAKSRSAIREAVYGKLYGIPYKYKYVEAPQKGRLRSNTAMNDDYMVQPASGETDLKPFDPLAGPTKAYVPPTNFNPDAATPFGDILDAPLG